MEKGGGVKFTVKKYRGYKSDSYQTGTTPERSGGHSLHTQKYARGQLATVLEAPFGEFAAGESLADSSTGSPTASGAATLLEEVLDHHDLNERAFSLITGAS